MSIFLHSVESILTIILMFMAGYFMTRAGWLDNRAGDVFAKVILNASLPCYMIWNLMSNFDRDKLEELSGGLVIPIISISCMYILSIILSSILKIRKDRIGIFRANFFTSNTIFIGLAVNLSLFGEESVPYVLLYYIVNTSFFWTVGVYEISRFDPEGIKHRFFSKETAKKVVSPALMGFIIAIILIMADIQLPGFLMDSFMYFGRLTTPLAMLFTGIVLYSVKLRNIRLDRDLLMLILARFILCPLTVILLINIFPVPPLMGKVFVIQAAMPTMTSTGVVAKAYNVDYEFGTVATAVTTVLSMFVIPVYMVLL